MTKYHNHRMKLKWFNPRDMVLPKVSQATKDPTQGKLSHNWEGPYKVVRYSRRGSYYLEDTNKKPLPHPWNAEHLKKYYKWRNQHPTSISSSTWNTSSYSLTDKWDFIVFMHKFYFKHFPFFVKYNPCNTFYKRGWIKQIRHLQSYFFPNDQISNISWWKTPSTKATSLKHSINDKNSINKGWV